MDAHFWVHLSTVIFLVGIFLIAKKMVLSALDTKRQEIKTLLEDTKAKRQEAQELYDSFMQKMDNLDKQAADILSQAEQTANQMLSDAEKEVELLVSSKKIEVEKRLADYEAALKDKIVSEYADSYAAFLKDKIEAKKLPQNLDFSILGNIH